MSTARTLTRRLGPTSLALALVTGSLTLAPAVTAAAAAPKPMNSRSAADPGFNRFGKSYYIYATGSGSKNFPVFTSTQATGHYRYVGQALSTNPPKLGLLWAPHVIQRGKTYFLFFSAQPTGQPHCLYYSTSSRPSGGFGKPKRLFCGRKESATVTWEAIDPSTYLTADGKTTYLVWRAGHVKDFPIGDYDISSRKLSFSGSKVAMSSKIHTLAKVRNGPIIEAPDVIRHDNRLYLFVSRDRYDTNAYRTEVWTGTSITGRFTKPKKSLMTTSTKFGYGPGGAEVLGKPSNKVYIAYHYWKNDKNYTGPGRDGNTRVTRVAEVVWSGRTPRVK